MAATALVMELDQTSSAFKKPKRGHTRSKKKRLTFQDEVDITRSEDDLKSNDITTKVIATRGTTVLTFGLCLVKNVSQQGLDLIGATYNTKTKRLVLLDGKGLFSLDLLPSNCTVKREMCFEKYKFNMVRIITYSEKYNVYFVLHKDFSIKVYNKYYHEVCSLENPGPGRVTFIAFNPVKDEVISGGLRGVKIWKFKEKAAPDYANPDAMFHYSLIFSTEYPYMGNKLCTNMDFDVLMQRFYCFSDCHFFCYDINGTMLFEIPNAHQSAIISCVYSLDVNILLTSSRGSEIKSWNDQGSLLHVFQGHTKTVTKILLHPSTASLFISGSLDGSVKLWSFDTMDIFYSLSPFHDGILRIGTMDNSFLYCFSARNLHIYDLNSFTSFWTHVHSQISNLSLCSADGKSSRVVALGADNSLRIFSLHNGTKLCTVLPPPFPTLLQPVLSFTYNRTNGTVYFLLSPWDIWVYTARTDPACRAAVWTIGELQQHLYRKHPLHSCIQKNEYFQHTQTRNFKTPVSCECLCSLSSPFCYLTDEGLVYADNQEFLVLGMQDGRILFLHTSIQNLVYYEMRVYKDPVIHLRHDVDQQQLIIMCQGPYFKRVHFRSLPALELVCYIDVSNDTLVFTRLNNSLFLGLKSGAVDVLNILNEDDKKVYSEKTDVNNNGEDEQKDASYYSENYHKGPVIAVDSCKNLSIFLSCGSDFIIKIWDIQKNLVADITLDNTLTAACFLNTSGDILLAFKSDLYVLTHDKALGLPKTSVDTSRVSAAESYIFESQSSDVQERDKIAVSKSIEMESYLVPYKGFAFTEDFTSELLVLPKKKGKPAWRLPMAPSKIYCSPCASEASLKIFDFLLQPRTPNLEEQDKAEMSRRMVVTKDMKYVLGPKPAVPACWEIPFFGVSPCSSKISEQSDIRTQPEEQVAEAESELAIVELLEETPIKEQQQINEEIAPEAIAPEIMPESACTLDNVSTLDKKQTFVSTLNISSFIYEKRKEKISKKDSKVKMPVSKKLLGKESLGLRKIRTPKHKRVFSATKSAVISQDVSSVSHAKSAISVDKVKCTEVKLETAGGKVFPALEIEGLAPAAKRPPSRRTYQKTEEVYESPSEKRVVRAVSWRRRENERIQQVEERRRLIQEFERRPCSRNRCFTPTNSQQYQNLQPSESLPEAFFTWMKPYSQIPRRPYTVMEETTIHLPRDFSYRLAWGTPTTQNLEIKMYQPRMKFSKSLSQELSKENSKDHSKDHSKDRRMSSLPVERDLQPTRSIPDKGKYILVNDPIPASSTPALSPLESKLLSARFPRQKEKILRSLF
ncbi:uncharacterized protein LOC128342526 isoform X2 [Hemicordylus capensis]|uniref:uncharacterized protein LOC128342526 isoform X2 n=1 Tax=Hemicordylus capensis TaxID=884348 RepID=UPI00230448E1|nr:uncharacterized protein LOC128342526 isoform X2 [Hemicordylus capensis]